MDTLKGSSAPSFKTPCKAHCHHGHHQVTIKHKTKVAEGAGANDEQKAVVTVEAAAGMQEEENGRERLKRHRGEVAGRVWIPETWGQEDFLKDWIDCSAFDASLAPARIMSSARAALVQERTTSRITRRSSRCANQ